MVLKNITCGRYTAFASTTKYAFTPVALDVKPGRITKAVIRLSKGQGIVFKLIDAPENPLYELPWVGYRIVRADNSGPALRDEKGPYWGSVAPLSDEPAVSSPIPIQPGKYRIEMVLRNRRSSSELSDTENLWSGTRTVTVAAGKDCVIGVGPVKE